MVATDPVLVYLHGVGGVRPGWAEHLLVDQQIEHRIDRVRIVAPSYASILAAEFDDTEFDDTEFDDTEFDDTEFDDTEFDDTEFDDTEFDIVDGDGEGYAVDAESTARYRTRQRELAARVAQCSDVVPAGLAWPSLLPRPGRWPIAGFLDSPARFIGGLDQARRYVRDPRLRDRVLAQVRSSLSVLPDSQSGPLVLIGHSLGAVVALDLLAELDRPVDLLVTVGAPLGHPDISQRLVTRGIDLARLGSWLNVVHLLDPVPLGHGAGAMFPAATDAFLPVLAGGHGLGGFARGLTRAATAHLDSTYLSSEVVRTIVAQALAAPGADLWPTPQEQRPSSTR